MKTEFRTVDTSTLKGLKQAERLHMAGWKQSRVGLFTTQFYRVKPTKFDDPTKYAVEYQVHGLYSGKWEEVTAEDTRSEGLARLQEYRANETATAFKLVRKRIKIVRIADGKQEA